MENISIFSYLDYLKFIEDYAQNLPNKGRGFRKLMADQLNCQMSFITHVLNGDKDFSTEQIFKLSTLFSFNTAESEYFMNLHGHNRAGTMELKNYYLSKLEKIKSDYLKKQNQEMSTEALSFVDQAIYYSAWYYSAVHMASFIPALQNLDTLKGHLEIDKISLNKALDFLSTRNLITFDGQTLGPGKTNLYMERKSILMDQYHCSWRLKVLEEFRKVKETDLHFTLCFALSEKDLALVRQNVLNTINETLRILGPSKEEKLALLTIDMKEL